MLTIRFLTQCPGLGAVYNRGDIARFPADIAETLIDRDLAEPVEAAEPDNDSDLPPTPENQAQGDGKQETITPKSPELPLGKDKP